MSITTMSSREFNQDTSRAKKAAEQGPVFITDQGQLAHVLLSVEEYRRITQPNRNIVDMLALPVADEIEFETPRAGQLSRPIDLTI